MMFEEWCLLFIGVWDDIEELFIFFKILDLIYFIYLYISEILYKDLVLLIWCMEEEVKIYLGNK